MGHREGGAGYNFLEYTTDPGRQAGFTGSYVYSPPREKRISMVPAEHAKSLPDGYNLKTRLFGGSAEALDFCVDHQEELTER